MAVERSPVERRQNDGFRIPSGILKMKFIFSATQGLAAWHTI
jgi:hypothetical protein